DAPPQTLRLGEAVQAHRHRLEAPGQLGADDVREPCAGDVLVVSLVALDRRGEARLSKPRRVAHRPRKRLAGESARLAILLPARPGEIAANDALDVDALAASDAHRAQPPGVP